MTIKVNDLSFRYENSSIKVLKGINLEARPGELLFVIGGNGSGKSTLLSCIAGLIPDLVKGELSGDITLDNINTGENSVQRHRVGMVLQDSDTYLFEEVFQEIAYPLVNYGVSREKVFNSVFDTSKELGVSHLLQRKMSTLSGGERQKVAVAAALATKSSFLLLDEPVEQLDPDAAHEVMRFLKKLAGEGKTVIVSGRSLDFAKIYADKIVLLDKGTLFSNISAGSVICVNGFYGDDTTEILKAADKSTYERQVLADEVSNLPSVVEFQKVTHLFPGGGGVADIDFTIKHGEVIAIMGPNGAGKSTLLKHCLGLLRPQKGEILIYGENASSIPSWKLAERVGMLFQNPDDQIFNERVDKEVAWSLKVRGMKWENAIMEAKKVLSELGLHDLCHKHPHELTRSQRQLIGLASVMVTHPDLIILDEPSKSLDSKHVSKIINSICHQSRHQGAIVIITHDPSLAWLYADRVALIVAGRLSGIGNTKDILLNHELMEKAKLLQHPFIIRLYENN